MGWFIAVTDLPADFDYPPEFVRAVESGLTAMEPWFVLEGDLLLRRHRGLQERFPERRLVPSRRGVTTTTSPAGTWRPEGSP